MAATMMDGRALAERIRRLVLYGTYADGRECWFRLADEAPREERYERPRTTIIKFSSSRAHDDVVSMRLMAAAGRRPILVGASRRRVRPAGATH